MNWETQESLSRDDALKAISDKAKDEGISGAFKVYYNGRLIATPEDLPDQVDMRDVRVSSVLNNA